MKEALGHPVAQIHFQEALKRLKEDLDFFTRPLYWSNKIHVSEVLKKLKSTRARFVLPGSGHETMLICIGHRSLCQTAHMSTARSAAATPASSQQACSLALSHHHFFFVSGS